MLKVDYHVLVGELEKAYENEMFRDMHCGGYYLQPMNLRRAGYMIIHSKKNEIKDVFYCHDFDIESVTLYMQGVETMNHYMGFDAEDVAVIPIRTDGICFFILPEVVGELVIT